MLALSWRLSCSNQNDAWSRLSKKNWNFIKTFMSLTGKHKLLMLRKLVFNFILALLSAQINYRNSQGRLDKIVKCFHEIDKNLGINWSIFQELKLTINPSGNQDWTTHYLSGNQYRKPYRSLRRQKLFRLNNKIESF